MEDQVARHKRFGDSVYLQEPNLKSGCGGLRDYQNLLWITYFKEGSLSTNQLVGKDWLSESDQRRIESAYDFLLRLRTDLHYATGRATDILHHEFAGTNRDPARLFASERAASQRGAHAGLLPPHAKYPAGHRANYAAIRERTRYEQNPRSFQFSSTNTSPQDSDW